ncbi:sulfurtransferase-like selenium metabolism protein YedF [Desulfoscipio gibsoniae]|uniref:Selenium metabolism protein YedF n=1 Tax=Desulfoscipio gibsoniae DSM 7213 TaxID=767817 RepID=R4KE33_9FIRM|nr:sulfurtransferase-like selenium metabolism protein YedF [Desulfoscipio gibsoniae]AGL00849.1 selenium metabolism protein YedF [Desulfoscipio gibsoniae DSM 7213]
MNHKLVDCRGLACPHPVINTKKALEEAGVDTVTTIVDNDVARQNVVLFAKNAGYQVNEQPKEGFYHLTITRIGAQATANQTNESAAPTPAAVTPTVGPVYFITTNALGQGSPDLGQVLMKSLFTTLVAMDPPPAALLFLNTGVFLTCAGTPVQEQLEKLHTHGTAVLSCGTCLEYYGIKEKLLLGDISNMFEINNWLNKPHKAITIA